MPDPFDSIDVGADFEAFAVGLAAVTVTSVDAIEATTLATAAGVSAAKLEEVYDSAGARGGEVGVTTCAFWLRAGALGFSLKKRDRITEAGGAVWVVDAIEASYGGLARCPVTKYRS